MKKTMTAVLAALTLAGSAQAAGFDDFAFGYDETPFSFTAQFGLNISNFRMNDIPIIGMNPKAGFNIGLHAEYILPQCYGTYLNAGIEYSMKGAKDHFPGVPDDAPGATSIARPMYLSVPIHVGYRYNVLDDLGLYADFGPYFALGTNGKHVLKMDDYSADLKHGIFNTPQGENANFYELQRADFGLGFRIGAEYARHYDFILSCDWGITDMLTQEQKHILVVNTGAAHPSMKNFAAGLTFGYRF